MSKPDYCPWCSKDTKQTEEHWNEETYKRCEECLKLPRHPMAPGAKTVIKSTQPKFGIDAGKIKIADNFDEPLNPETFEPEESKSKVSNFKCTHKYNCKSHREKCVPKLGYDPLA